MTPPPTTIGTAGRSSLRLHRPDEDDAGPPARSWEINGFPAVILVWSPEEWERLEERPADAQAYPNGCRAALRMA